MYEIRKSLIKWIKSIDEAFVLENILNHMNKIIWGPATLCIFLGTGIFFLVVFNFMPWRRLGYALSLVFRPEKPAGKVKGDITPFASLMTSLGACMGTGNIAGVACALVLGGPGALFWMCLSSFTGLPVIFAECVLSVRYREKSRTGMMCGGPMYVMKYGIGKKTGMVLAVCFSLFTVGASFGIGNMTQTNAAAAAMKEIWHIPKPLTGFFMAVSVFLVLVAGIGGIGRICSIIVPAASMLYLSCAFTVIILNYRNIPGSFLEIIHMAFSAKAVTCGIGGLITASMYTAMKWGIARGVFSNEAGLGSAPIAAAAAKTDAPAKQGYIHMTGAFIDTAVMCTVTGLAICASGVLGMKDMNGQLITGVELTIRAFETALKGGGHIICAGMLFFAFPTLLGWAYYGEKALIFLTGQRFEKYAVVIYRILFCVMCYVGAVKALKPVWDFSDIMNGLMAVPNLICLWIKWREVREICLKEQKK